MQQDESTLRTGETVGKTGSVDTSSKPRSPAEGRETEEWTQKLTKVSRIIFSGLLLGSGADLRQQKGMRMKP